MTERPILFSAPMVRAILAGTKTQTRRVLKATPPPGAQRVIRPFRDERLQWAATDPHDMEQGQLVLGEAPRCPYGVPGDRLWVRETFDKRAMQISHPHYAYRATCTSPLGKFGDRWTPSIHMHRWASRITLELTDVRVERLRDISQADAQAEGIAELVPASKRAEGMTPAALAFAAAAAVNDMPRTTRRGFLAGALAAALGFKAAAGKASTVEPGRMTRAPTPAELYAVLWESINGAGSWQANPWVWVVEFKRAPTDSPPG